MDYNELILQLKDTAKLQIGMWHKENEEIIEKAITAITDLLARAEAAEARAEKAERAVAELMGISQKERITTCFGHPLDRVMELVEADREGRCSISPKFIRLDEVSEFNQEQYRLFMGKFSKGEKDGN